MKRNNVSGKGVEGIRSLEAKFKVYYARAEKGELDEFELKMFKAVEKSLGLQGYFDIKYRNRRKPLFWKPAQ